MTATIDAVRASARERTCPACGKAFATSKENKKYCDALECSSNASRAKLHRKRKGDEYRAKQRTRMRRKYDAERKAGLRGPKRKRKD